MYDKCIDDFEKIFPLGETSTWCNLREDPFVSVPHGISRYLYKVFIDDISRRGIVYYPACCSRLSRILQYVLYMSSTFFLPKNKGLDKASVWALFSTLYKQVYDYGLTYYQSLLEPELSPYRQILNNELYKFSDDNTSITDSNNSLNIPIKASPPDTEEYDDYSMEVINRSVQCIVNVVYLSIDDLHDTVSYEDGCLVAGVFKNALHAAREDESVLDKFHWYDLYQFIDQDFRNYGEELSDEELLDQRVLGNIMYRHRDYSSKNTSTNNASVLGEYTRAIEGYLSQVDFSDQKEHLECL